MIGLMKWGCREVGRVKMQPVERQVSALLPSHDGRAK